METLMHCVWKLCMSVSSPFFNTLSQLQYGPSAQDLFIAHVSTVTSHPFSEINAGKFH